MTPTVNSLNAQKKLLCLALFLFGFGLLASGQSSGFSARQVTLTDTVLLNTIKKYNHSIQKKEVMVIGVEKRQDSLIYYITGMISLFKLSQNIPLYTKISNQYILLYSGIERSVKIGLLERKQLLAMFKTRLENDLLADGKRDPMSLGGGYDPIQVTVMTKGGQIVYEDFKKGFGPNGFPYFIYDELN